MDFTGAIRRHEFYCDALATVAGIVTPGLPVIDEELFEWITLCDAIRTARHRFVFVEVGAGFGRWTANAVLAARHYGVTDISAVMVEAEPKHCEWARINMADNAIEQFELIEAAVAADDGEALFCVRWSGGLNARDWYGQVLMPEDVPTLPTPKTYCNYPVFDFLDGWEGIRIRTASLASIIGNRQRIDLMDFDIQGAEGDVIASSVDVLTERVRRLYIETHNSAVEQRIIAALAAADWQRVFDFPIGGVRQTPYGPVDFNGNGCQSWINPRLA